MAKPVKHARPQGRNRYLYLLCFLLLSACAQKRDDQRAVASLPAPAVRVTSSGTTTDTEISAATASGTASHTASHTETVSKTQTDTQTQTEARTETRTETDAPPVLPSENVPTPRPRPEPQVVHEPSAYRLPEYDPAWGLKREIYEKAVRLYAGKRSELANARFVSVVDFSRPSKQKRFFLFDLATDRLHSFLTTHGSGSDPRHTGMAHHFSNAFESKRSSLGAYVTAGTYLGKHGYSLRLRGLDETNSQAWSRLIVIHGATYVSEIRGYAGRSSGCFAFDPKVVRQVIDRIKGGSLLVADR